ncbi:MAG TPA: tryptophan--tRNA ligase, partial [Gammaproteobacteria bacterium]|nr:tryptophan--tRNA ligase [Gammaproteobacteria bacterium]
IRAAEYEKDPGYVRQVLVDGAEHAQEEAEATLDQVKEAMGLGRFY